MLPQIRFVLIETSHPGNIGATARAMKCMALSRLALVAPKAFPDDEARARAAGAEDLLDAAAVHADVNSAIEDCVYVVGTSARARSIEWPLAEPRAAARRAVRECSRGPVAVLFGRERSGLTNKEVDLCHTLVRIPTSRRYASLNLASAAQIMAYELFLAARAARGRVPDKVRRADRGSMDLFYRHLEETLYQLDFVKVDHHPTRLMRKLVRLFNRAQPSDEEINILRGILAAAQSKRSG